MPLGGVDRQLLQDLTGEALAGGEVWPLGPPTTVGAVAWVALAAVGSASGAAAPPYEVSHAGLGFCASLLCATMQTSCRPGATAQGMVEMLGEPLGLLA